MNVETDDSKFTWGDSVIIRKNSPTKFHPGKFASICGTDKISFQKEADELSCKNQKWNYLVEFEAGSFVEIPECY